jgi:apolipoprotein N-acyltransferase
LPLSHFWGLWRLSTSPTAYRDAAVVRLVQPNVSQSDKWRSDNAVAIFDTLTKLSVEGPDAGAVTHIVWPESSVPFLLDEDKVARERIAGILTPGKTLLAGAIRREIQAGCETCPDLYFTSILMMDDTGGVTGAYDKWRLVPGGEYLPLEDFLSRFGFRKVVSLPESFTAGAGPRNLDVPGLGLSGMLICYEVIFSHALVNEVRPQLLINVTNDGWFGRSVGPYQHIAQARMRSIEQGLPLLRSANTGISAVIDSVGRIVAQTELEQSTYLDSRVPAAVAPTPYARWGDGLMFGFILVLIAVLRTSQLATLRQQSG